MLHFDSNLACKELGFAPTNLESKDYLLKLPNGPLRTPELHEVHNQIIIAAD